MLFWIGWFQNPDEFNEETLEQMMLTAIRKTVAVGRYAEKLNALKGIKTKHNVGTLVMVELGNCCKIGGMGELFKKFMELKQLSGYSGEGAHVACFGDEGYENAPLQVIRFDQTYRKSSYDVTRGKFYYFRPPDSNCLLNCKWLSSKMF